MMPTLVPKYPNPVDLDEDDIDPKTGRKRVRFAVVTPDGSAVAPPAPTGAPVVPAPAPAAPVAPVAPTPAGAGKGPLRSLEAPDPTIKPALPGDNRIVTPGEMLPTLPGGPVAGKPLVVPGGQTNAPNPVITDPPAVAAPPVSPNPISNPNPKAAPNPAVAKPATPGDSAPPTDDPMLHPQPAAAAAVPKMSQPLLPKHAGKTAEIEADRQRMYGNNPMPTLPGAAPASTPGAGAGAAPPVARATSDDPETQAHIDRLRALMPGSPEMEKAKQELEAARTNSPQNIARRSASSDPTIAGPEQDATAEKDRMAFSAAATAQGIDIDSALRNSATRAAQEQMKKNGVSSATRQAAGLGPQGAPVPSARWFGGEAGPGGGDSAAAKVVSAPGAPPITQREVLDIVNQSRDPRTGVPTIKYAQAKAKLAAERQAVADKKAAVEMAVGNARADALEKRRATIMDKYKPMTADTEVPNKIPGGPNMHERKVVNPEISAADKAELDAIEKEIAGIRSKTSGGGANVPTATGPNGQKIYHRNGKWVDEKGNAVG